MILSCSSQAGSPYPYLRETRSKHTCWAAQVVLDPVLTYLLVKWFWSRQRESCYSTGFNVLSKAGANSNQLSSKHFIKRSSVFLKNRLQRVLQCSEATKWTTIIRTLHSCLTAFSQAKPMWLVTEKAGWDGYVAKEQDQKKHKSLYKWNQTRNGDVLLPNVISMPQNLVLC